MPTTIASPVTLPTTARGQRFYVGMAATCFAVAVVGFMPTYWVPMARGTLDVAPITHLHALFFYGWLLLFVRQTSLAASGRLSRHRELGVAGVAVATGMCFVGLGMAIHSLRRLEAAGAGDPARAFTIVAVSAIALFAVLFALAIVNVKKPEVHKRLMLVATISMLQAGVGRWFLLFFAPSQPIDGPPLVPPVFVTVIPGLVTDLLIVAAMIHDRRTRGRVHPVYWWAGASVLAVQVLRVPLSTTSAWIQVTHWLLAVSP
jgi:hypothetical protein